MSEKSSPPFGHSKRSFLLYYSRTTVVFSLSRALWLDSINWFETALGLLSVVKVTLPLPRRKKENDKRPKKKLTIHKIYYNNYYYCNTYSRFYVYRTTSYMAPLNPSIDNIINGYSLTIFLVQLASKQRKSYRCQIALAVSI